MADLDALLLVLSHPTRRAALRLLGGQQKLCLCELMERLGVRQSSMSRHMAALKAAGLVADRRDAQWVRYRKTTQLDAKLKGMVQAILAADARITPATQPAAAVSRRAA
jgi:ArsR family transcriptional regulator